MLGVTQDRLLVAESVQVSGDGAVPPSFIIVFCRKSVFSLMKRSPCMENIFE